MKSASSTEKAASRVKPFLIEEQDGSFRVGAKYKSDDSYGPVAEVSIDKDWLHICTDTYEGAAMLHIETLPYLQRALRKLAKRLKEKQA